MKKQLHRPGCVFLLFWFFGAMFTGAEVTPEAQAKIDKGLWAVNSQNYDTAAENFREALVKSKPTDVYRRLGEMEARIPGRELRAICWLSASLVEEPEPEDAATVRSKIDLLKTAIRDKILALIQMAQESTQALPKGETRDHALGKVAALWEGFDDFAAAQKVIGMIEGNGPKSDALTNLAVAQADKAQKQFKAGDREGARKSLEEAQKNAERGPFRDDFALYRIAMSELAISREKIREGDFPGARESMHRAQKICVLLKTGYGADTQASIATAEIILAKAQLKAGDKAAAGESMVRALKIADDVKQPGSPLKLTLLQDMADAQIAAGDLAGARETLAEALKLVGIYKDPGHAQLEIAQAQARAGDVAAAKATAALIQGNPDWKFDVQRTLALIQIRAGDMPGAMESLAQATEAAQVYGSPEKKSQVLRVIADAQLMAGESAAACKTLDLALQAVELLPEGETKSWMRKAIATEQLRAGDKAAAEKTTQLIRDPDLKAKTLLELAEAPRKDDSKIGSLQTESFEIPRMSDRLMRPDGLRGEAWAAMVEQQFDKPWFTAYADFSDFMVMADQIEKAPVENGRITEPRTLNRAMALEVLASCMVNSESLVEDMLKIEAGNKNK